LELLASVIWLLRNLQSAKSAVMKFGGILEMRVLSLSVFCLLLASSVVAQQPTSPAKPFPPPGAQAATPRGPASPDDDDVQGLPATASKVAPDVAIITVTGLCPSASPSSAEGPHPTCQTQVSRAQFEKLADAVLANRQSASRQVQLAKTYPNLLAMAQAAEARGLDKSPHFQQRIAYARLQILSQELVRQIEEDSTHISEKEIADYYQTHSAEIDAATLERIYIPNRKRGTASAENSEAEMNQLAEKIRARALAGESFLNLQKDAYTLAGMTDVPPNPSMGEVHANGIPPGHASVFNLKTGEVSQVLSDSTGHYIYKLDDKQTGLSEKMQAQIHRVLQRQHRDQSIQAIQQAITTELNPAYFGPTDKHGAAGDPDSK
jgi:hypothetical protein